MNLDMRIRAAHAPFIFIALTVLDQLSKYLVRYFSGLYVCNRDLAWGIIIPGSLFWIFWIATMAAIIFILKKTVAEKNYLPLMFIFSGAFSNAIDRVLFGCVIDFIDFKFWPVFNLADVFIALGMFLLLAKFLKK